LIDLLTYCLENNSIDFIKADNFPQLDYPTLKFEACFEASIIR